MGHNARVWIALWVVYIIWGSTYLGIELAGETMPPLFAAGVRFILAGLLMVGFVAWRRGVAPLRLTRREILASIVVGLLLPGGNALLFVAEREVPIGLASLIIASIPLWVMLMRIAARERLDRVGGVSVVIGFAGIAVLVRPGGSSGSLLYLLCAVVAAFMWALGSFLSPRLPVPKDAFAATAAQMLAGGIALMIVALAIYSPHELDPSRYSARSIAGLWYLIVFGSLLGYSAYVWLLANAPLGQVATYAYVNPVVAIALGAIFLNEAITLRIIVGAALVLVSVAIVVRRESRAETEIACEAPAGAGAIATERTADVVGTAEP